MLGEGRGEWCKEHRKSVARQAPDGKHGGIKIFGLRELVVTFLQATELHGVSACSIKAGKSLELGQVYQVIRHPDSYLGFEQ